ncbi:stalk domain-containing protein [Paenibacillus sp.]|uniref:stalk domain-containing protein n=1 Tax=Paenibacillus sp. TaxID=58172 RepID=UPI002D4FB156|nr:stalk domain-containing protein [Paenibacillus sp.]HZG86594.1 stalk domain-containing protein [Paenibacillus sp.]
MVGKRGAIALLLAAMFIAGPSPWPGPPAADGAAESATRELVFDYDNRKVYLNGELASTVYPMTIHNGRIYVAARQLADAFGFTAEFDPKSYDAVLRNDTTRIHVNQQAKLAWVDDMPVPYDGLGLVQDGRLLLSIRAIADYMGLYVGYDSATRQAVVADPEFPYVNPINPSRPQLVPIDFARYAKYPLISPEERRDDSRTLLFSDSPETFRELGILYRDDVNGKARLFLTHVNGTKEPAQVLWLATNEGDAPAKVSTTRSGIAAASKDYALQGREALAMWYGEEGTRGERTIAPGETVALYSSAALGPMDGAHAIFDVETDGELRFDVVAAEPNASLAAAAGAPFASRDIHDRGTFPVSDISLAADASEWNGKPARIRIGAVGSLNDHWVVGTDAVTGKPSQNFGNYGVFYHVTVENPGKAVFVLVPMRGLYRGTVLFDGAIVRTDTLQVGEGYAIGRTDGDERSVSMTLSAASGSFMPFELLVYPLP